MAEIIIEPLSLKGSGFFNGKSTKIVSSTVPIGSQGYLTSKVVLIVKSTSAISGITSFPTVKSTLVKYVKSFTTSIATFNGVWAHKFKTVSGSLFSEGIVEAYTHDRDIRQSMKDYLPKYYDDFEDVMKMVETQANEVTRIQAKLNEILDQFYVTSSTIGLDRWETETDITKIPQRSVDSRRHFINAKLRGVGTVTKELLSEVVNAFYYSSVEEQPSEMKVAIKLLGKRGIPKNLEDIEESMEDIIPAHVGTEYLFTYLTWGEVEEVDLKWVGAEEYTHKGLEEAFLIDPGFPHQN